MKANFKTLEFIYQDTQIHFLLSNEGNVIINATEMAKAFNKKVSHFLENENTKNFINVCLNSRNSDFINITSIDDLYISKQKIGTYFHRILALKFAAWLDAEFELWIFNALDKILFGDFPVKRKEDLERKAELVLKKDEILEKLNEYEIYKDYLDIKKELSLINSKLTKQDNAVIETKLKSLFEQDFIKN